ncbi:hypothetical protein ALC57_03267, partial [Trachymyrmex cornetzi]
KLRRLLEVGCNKNALEIRPVTVTLNKHSRVSTVQVNFCESTPHITFMLDTGSGLNIIKENFLPKDKGSYQTPLEELNNSGITEESFHISLLNSTPVDCKEVSNQISLCNTTQVYQKESKERAPFSKRLNYQGLECPQKMIIIKMIPLLLLSMNF